MVIEINECSLELVIQVILPNGRAVVMSLLASC